MSGSIKFESDDEIYDIVDSSSDESEENIPSNSVNQPHRLEKFVNQLLTFPELYDENHPEYNNRVDRRDPKCKVPKQLAWKMLSEKQGTTVHNCKQRVYKLEKNAENGDALSMRLLQKIQRKCEENLRNGLYVKKEYENNKSTDLQSKEYGKPNMKRKRLTSPKPKNPNKIEYIVKTLDFIKTKSMELTKLQRMKLALHLRKEAANFFE